MNARAVTFPSCVVPYRNDVRLSSTASHRRTRAARASARLQRTHSEDLDELADVQAQSLEKHVIQWYPGHIAKAERQLKEQLSKVDIVFEVRDARILKSTAHPQIQQWIQNKRHFLLVNRLDMVSQYDLRAWRQHFESTGQQAFFTDGKSGAGVSKVVKAADALSAQINAARTRRGLKPRAVRACVVGYPNIGKSALINRLANRRVVASAALPGVTRTLRWIRMGSSLDLLDSPGIIPGAISDQGAATRLAICNDIGEAAYVDSAVASALLAMLPSLPRGRDLVRRVEKRYGVSYAASSSEDLVWQVADKLFLGDPERAGARILKDYRDLRWGSFALEHP